jgi:hypothetical protein
METTTQYVPTWGAILKDLGKICLKLGLGITALLTLSAAPAGIALFLVLALVSVMLHAEGNA